MPKFELIKGGKPAEDTPESPVPPERDIDERTWFKNVESILSGDPECLAYLEKFTHLSEKQRYDVSYFGITAIGVKKMIDSHNKQDPPKP